MTYTSASGRNSDTRIFRIIGVVFFAIGVLAAAGAVIIAVMSGQNQAERTEEATGTVVDVAESRGSRRDSDGHRRPTLTYCPVVEYSVDGTEHRVQADVCDDSPPQVGEAIVVRYNPANPGDGVIDSAEQQWLPVIIVGGIGAVFLLVGGVLARVGFRRPQVR